MGKCIYCDKDGSKDHKGFCERHWGLMNFITIRETFKQENGKFWQMKCDGGCPPNCPSKKVNIILSLLEKDIDSDTLAKIMYNMSGKVFEAVVSIITIDLKLGHTLAWFEKNVETGRITENDYNTEAKRMMYIKQVRERCWGDKDSE
jgi:hypothetical protein